MWQFCATKGEVQKAFCLHKWQFSWCVSNVLSLSLGLIVAVTDICASPYIQRLLAPLDSWIFFFFLPSRLGFNSCMILGGKENVFQTEGCHSLSLPPW